MPHHPLSRTTHTLDMAQLAEIGARLNAPGAPTLTADEVCGSDAGVPGPAVLTRVRWEGPPEFPYIYGDFSGPGGSAGPARVPLHTGNLLKISHALGLHHRWGV